MINKRFFIKNIISHNDECTFYDKKETLDFKTDIGKGKFIKHICALSNTNPYNDSFLIIGVSDDNKVKGTSFFDDANIQNLVSSSLINAPKIKYENISFPHLKSDRPIGLLTIHGNNKISSFSKKIGAISKDTIYHRIGSKSMPVDGDLNIDETNLDIVNETYKYSNFTVKDLIDGVFEFFKQSGKEYNPQYVVFQDQFVVCWSGYKDGEFYNEVDIQIINEGKHLFFSAIYDVKIHVSDDEIKIDRYEYLGFDEGISRYPFNSTIIKFNNNGEYTVTKENIFVPPKFDKSKIDNLYKRSKDFEEKCLSKAKMNDSDWEFGEGMANYFLICYFNGINSARQDFLNSIKYLDGSAAEWYMTCKEILDAYEND